MRKVLVCIAVLFVVLAFCSGCQQIEIEPIITNVVSPGIACTIGEEVFVVNMLGWRLSGDIYKSSDGGVNWTKIFSHEKAVHRIFAKDENHLYVEVINQAEFEYASFDYYLLDIRTNGVDEYVLDEREEKIFNKSNFQYDLSEDKIYFLDDSIYVSNFDGTEQKKLTEADDYFSGFLFSGGKIFYEEELTLSIFDIARNKITKTIDRDGKYFYHSCTDGENIFFGSDAISVYDMSLNYVKELVSEDIITRNLVSIGDYIYFHEEAGSDDEGFDKFITCRVSKTTGEITELFVENAPKPLAEIKSDYSEEYDSILAQWQLSFLWRRYCGRHTGFLRFI